MLFQLLASERRAVKLFLNNRRTTRPNADSWVRSHPNRQTLIIAHNCIPRVSREKTRGISNRYHSSAGRPAVFQIRTRVQNDALNGQMGSQLGFRKEQLEFAALLGAPAGEIGVPIARIYVVRIWAVLYADILDRSSPELFGCRWSLRPASMPLVGVRHGQYPASETRGVR